MMSRTGWIDPDELEEHRQATDWYELAEKVSEEERAELLAQDWESAACADEPQPEEDPW